MRERAATGMIQGNAIRPVIAYPRRVHIAISRRRRAVVLLLLSSIAVLWVAGCRSPERNPKVPPGARSSGGKQALIQTDRGVIAIEFLEADAPKAVENFRLLAEHGYYDGLTFHRIVRGFMIQGGDPVGDGTGGQSAWGAPFADEIDRESPLYRAGYRRGLVAMANRGANTNGSQFFILHQDYPLPPNYVIFARVTAGMETVDAIADTPITRDDNGGEASRPAVPPIIKTVTIRP
jgi:cyclophilin family peptidyl-prolyl cis-trans isomerase